MGTKTLNIRVEEEITRDLDRVADYYATTRAGLLKKIVEEGLREAILRYAADMYANREVSLERAAEIAGISLFEMLDYLRKKNIFGQRSVRDIREDAKQMLIRAGRGNLAERLDLQA